MAWGNNPDVTIPDPSNRGREALSKAELCARLTAAFRRQPGCASVSVIGVYRLASPDTSGCNWSFTLLLEPGGTPPEVYGKAYAELISIARTAWNLAANAR